MWGISPLYFNLEEYSAWIGIAESSLFGLKRDGDPEMGCEGYYWNQTDRFQFGRAFAIAERMLSAYLKHDLKRTWYCQEVYKFTGCEFHLRNKYVIALGEKTEEVVEMGADTSVEVTPEGNCEMRLDEFSIPQQAPLSYETIPTLSDIPSSVIASTVDFTDCSEVVIYYPDQTKWEINPIQVTISGTTATIAIPRTRLLAPAYFKDYPRKDPDSRPLYENNNVYLATVDVYRRFPDAAQAVTFVWYRKSCGCTCACLHNTTNPGDIVTQTGVGRIVDSRAGLIRVEPATFNGVTGEWDEAVWTECRPPDEVRVSYVSGIPSDCDGNCPGEPNAQLARAVIALAHSNLPKGFCACSVALNYFEQDAMIPRPDEGLLFANPFGMTRGAYTAWNIVKRESVGEGGLLA